MTEWHAAQLDEITEGLGTDLSIGLSRSEAIRRLAEVGPNELGGSEGPGRWRILASQFTDMLILILLIAAIVSGVLLQEWIDAGVILAIVVLNAVIGFTQEVRAEDALARLKEMAAPTALVVRDGLEMDVPASDVVPGDLLVLEAGIDWRESPRIEVDQGGFPRSGCRRPSFDAVCGNGCRRR